MGVRSVCLSARTLELLHKAGWTPSRQVDVGPYEAALVAEGYPVTSAVREFLKSFGGMQVEHPHGGDPEATDRFHLDTARAVDGFEYDRVRAYELRVGEPLIVVGEAFSEHMIVMMSPSGRVYAAYDSVLIRLGETGCEALQTLCEGGATYEVP